MLEINNRTRRQVEKQPLEAALNVARKILKIRKNQEISLAFVTPKEIQKINKAYRGKDAVTDVLSFEENSGAFIGEILICLAQAEKQARVAGWPLKNEIVKLLIHGYLHLIGYDHKKVKDADVMEALETKILTIICSV